MGPGKKCKGTSAVIIPSSRREKKPYSTWTEWLQLPDFPTGITGVTLHVGQGRIWIGHGDWDHNYGPTDLLSVGPSGDLVTHMANVETEAFDVFRLIDGDIYAPYTDPTNGNYLAYATNAGGSWHSVTVPTTVASTEHTFDICKTSHGLWVVGSPTNWKGGARAPVVVLSEDDGATWHKVIESAEGIYGMSWYGIVNHDDQPYIQGIPRNGVGKNWRLTTSDGGQTWHESPLDLDLTPYNYNRPDAYRGLSPSKADLALRRWAEVIDRPYRYPYLWGAWPVVLDGWAYYAADSSESGWSIYRRPAPPVR